jgi:glycosyltransferase involved in cell wall biosynthesis
MTGSPAPADDDRTLALLAPGSLDTPTGGYAYDRRMAHELRARGWRVDVHVVEGGFPFPDPSALNRADAVLGGLADGTRVLCDGLAFGAMPDAAVRHGSRLCLVALVHHPLALETGLAPEAAAALAASERTALAATRGVVVTSIATAAGLADYGVSRDRIAVVEPGIDPAARSRGTRAADATADVELLCVASLVPRKGHLVLLEALARLRRLPWRLTCVGSPELDPDAAARVHARVNELGLASRVTFTGAAIGADLDRAYERADAFVLATYYEGYGLAVAEAVARGLPVVCSDTGAAAALVGADSGVIVPPGEVEALTAALARIVGDDAQRAVLARGAAARAATLRTWPQAAAVLETALLDACRGELQR